MKTLRKIITPSFILFKHVEHLLYDKLSIMLSIELNT